MVQEIRKLAGGGIIIDTVISRIRPKPVKHQAVIVALAAVVKLHHPAKAVVFLSEEQHKRSLILRNLRRRQGLLCQPFPENSFNLIVCRRLIHHIVQAMV